MVQTNHRRQKKADRKKRQERVKKIKQTQRDQKLAQLADFKAKAPIVKRFLKRHGHERKFYDFMDSYVDAFHRECQQAYGQLPSLLGIYEVTDDDYYRKHDGAFAAKLGHPGLTQIFFTFTDVDEDEYTANDRKSNVNGVTIGYRNPAGELKTIILIRRMVPAASLREIKYAFKIVALFHEMGHVQDLEKGLHLREGCVVIVDAEVYANQYAMQRLLDGDYQQALSTFLSAVEKLTKGDGYQRVVADRLIASGLFADCQEAAKGLWSEHLTLDGLSNEEIMEVGSAWAAITSSVERK